MTFAEPKYAAAVGGPADPEAAAAAALAVDPRRRDGIRVALDAGEPPRPELAAAASLLRSMRLRGFRPDDLEAVRSVLAPLDATEASAARDHAWAVGQPEPAEGDRDGRVSAAGPEVDLDDLFGGAPAVAAACRLAATIATCSTDLPALGVLALLSAACACKVVGRSRDRVAGRLWVGTPSLYVAPEVASGEGKSLVRDVLAGKMLDKRALEVALWHAELAEREGEEREWLAERKNIVTGELRAMAKAGDRGAASEKARDLAKIKAGIERPPTKPPDWIQWGAISPEHFVRQAQAGGFVALFPDEGKSALARFLGEGGGREYIDPLLSAFSGASFTHTTIAGEQRGDRSRFNRFRCAMFLPIQPGVLSPATQVDGAMLTRLASRGLLARLLIARPRRFTSAELPGIMARGWAANADASAVRATMAAFESLLADVVHADGQAAGEGGEGDPARAAEERLVGRPNPLTPSRPWEFDFDQGASDELNDYQARTRVAAAVGGPADRPGMAELYKRLADHAHRLSTLLAVIRRGGIQGGGVVEREDVARAIRFLDGYVLPHAEGVHRRAVYDPIGDDAELLLTLIRRRGEITMHNLKRALPHDGRGWGKAKGGDRSTRLEVTIEALAADGQVIIESAGRGSRVIRAVAY